MIARPNAGPRCPLFALLLASAVASALSAPLLAQTTPVSEATATIRVDPDYLTMINVFTPTAGTQDEVAAAIQAGLEGSVSKMPGFIRSTVHRSKDSSLIVVYAQWEDQASVDAAVEAIKAGAAPDMLRALTIARSDLHPYDVLSIHAPQGG